jgi:hypothetical protein
LPVLVALYRSPEKAPKAEAKKGRRRAVKDRTKAEARERARRRAEAQRARGARAGPARRHKTPSKLMNHWFSDRQFVFVGDGGYGTHTLARFAHRHRRHLTVASMFYTNAALHDPRRRVVGKKNGRPRRKGDKRPTPTAVVAATEQREALDVSWYGGGRLDVEAVSGMDHWHKSG